MRYQLIALIFFVFSAAAHADTATLYCTKSAVVKGNTSLQLSCFDDINIIGSGIVIHVISQDGQCKNRFNGRIQWASDFRMNDMVARSSRTLANASIAPVATFSIPRVGFNAYKWDCSMSAHARVTYTPIPIYDAPSTGPACGSLCGRKK
jgi:hypothetical protein